MLELRLLQAHVERCPSCARVAADIEAISAAIRSAPLEPPPAQIALPVLRRRSVFRHVPGVHVAGRVAAVAAVGLFAVVMGSWSSDRIVEPMPVKPIVIDETSLETVDAEPVEMRVYRRAALISGTAAAPRVAKRPGTQPL
jgi:anti-sigma factor RsiW